MAPRVNEAAVALIKASEGFSPRAYKDPAGLATIGFGHKIRPGEIITEPINLAQGLSLLAKDIDRAAAGVQSLTDSVPLTDNQFSALVCLAFNIGLKNLLSSTLLQKLRCLDYAGAAAQFDRWVYGTEHGQKLKLPGLVTRRARERALFSQA